MAAAFARAHWLRPMAQALLAPARRCRLRAAAYALPPLLRLDPGAAKVLVAELRYGGRAQVGGEAWGETASFRTHANT